MTPDTPLRQAHLSMNAAIIRQKSSTACNCDLSADQQYIVVRIIQPADGELEVDRTHYQTLSFPGPLAPSQEEGDDELRIILVPD